MLEQSNKYARALLAAALALFLAECGGAPYVDSRREAGQRLPAGTSTADTVAICYSSRNATSEEVYRLAESECAKSDRAAEPAGQTDWSCTLSAPTQVFYRCVARPPKP